ncbi:hypothetical protein GQ466_10775 [Actinomadura rayongensis]|uniref:CoA transferase n=2 Tax=Actinomadura rayongensis TaxID=1429076 RepID=A0A6I4W4Z4_9ACTN|nr:hypothetical protein [Actinomadura rayongensis]
MTSADAPETAPPGRDEAGTVPTGRFARRAWADLGGDPALLGLIAPPEDVVPLPSALPVGELAADGVGVASLAANVVRARRFGGDVAPVFLSADRIAASYQSERLFRLDGRPGEAWAALSGFWRADDGWIRTHGNYPHHARRLRSLLGLAAGVRPAEFRAAVARQSAADLEERAVAAGAVVAAVRTPEQWRNHPQAAALAARPLVEIAEIGAADPRPWPPARADDLPLHGVRVLDLTRVIAGPVATRDLAFAGADVLRVDPPRHPEIAWLHLDTGQGKRSATLDLRDRGDHAVLHGLLADADVVVTGYRPGALDRFGLAPDALAARHPGLVIAQVSAWGATGPWSRRRGFDSIVQAATGIAIAESADGATPGALPAQALDHTSGHLLAAAIMTALVRQRTSGGTPLVSVALARVGHELLATDGATRAEQNPHLPTVTVDGEAGRITCAPPVLAFDGAPADYAWAGRPWAADDPRWEPRA